ncbi:MAG: triosephosphate isomerase (TIM) [Chloroflexi bacterium]|nr:MAG: triosephosphate isomerase (TIM) [Chloroflexota bacterium]
MRKPFVAGNWKMNKTVAQASMLVQELLLGLQAVPEVERVLCPPFTSLMILSAQLANTGVGLGAQNLHWEASGAYTGEIAPQMVKEFCGYVIIGHSERRAFFAESDETVNKKLKAALALGLIPIVCIGETLSEYETGKTGEVVKRQVLLGFKEIDTAIASQIVVAYEPIWAIGTGKASTGEDANAVLKDHIRPALANLFGSAVAQGIRILYGGSVTAANAEEFFHQSEVDGALVGGASLKPSEFIKIVEAARP